MDAVIQAGPMMATLTLVSAVIHIVSMTFFTVVRRGVCLVARTVERGGASLSAIPNPFSYNSMEVAA